MSASSLFDDLSRLTAIDAPSGFEEPILRYARERFSALTLDVRTDVRGNLYAKHTGRESALSIMVVAHADEIGFMVSHITPQGFLRFVKIGGPTEMTLPGRRVRVLGQNGLMNGIIGVKPGHMLSGDDIRRIPPVGDMYIDIGASSLDEARTRGAAVGTPVVFDGPLASIDGTALVFGKAIDDRAGVLALFEAARKLAGRDIIPTIVWCISVEEEIGLRGASVAAIDIQPDVVIAIDTCPAGGTPDLRTDELPWTIGGGPLIKVRETKGLSTHRPLRDLFIGIAGRNDIPFQVIIDTAGITDVTGAQQAGGGIAALSIGLPRRYSHSPVEMLDLRDLSALIDLLAAALPELTDRRILMRI